MGKLKQALFLTRNLFLCEWANKRTNIGFLLGMVIPFYWLDGFLKYVSDYGAPVNVLEAFIVVVQTPRSIIFFVIGWLLVVADAPFANGNTYFSLCRTNKKLWNCASTLYMAGQSVLYIFAMALPMAAASAFHGFAGKMWSSPVYALTKNTGHGYSGEYDVVFNRIGMMRSMNVCQAFFVTALCLGLYLFAVGQLLYTFNFLFRSIVGMSATFLVHITGYLTAWGGYRRFSLTACAIAADYADDYGMHIQPIVKLLGFIMVCILLQNILAKNADFRTDIKEQ